MSNLFWYNCLTITGLGIAAFAIYKKRHIIDISTLVVFYIFATSITWLGEFVVLGLFDSYAYKPGVFTDPWAENLLAHLLLNSTLWPGTATLVVAYSLGSGWIFLITAAFILIEYLFMTFGLYEHHWWKNYMTAMAVVLFLVISKMWFPKINQPYHRLSRIITFFYVAFVIIHLPIPLLLLFGKQYYNVGLVENMIRSSTIFILVYQLVETLILVYFVGILNKWYWKLVPFVIAFVGQSTLASMNILIFQDGWNLFYTTLIYALCIAVCILIEQYTLPTPLKDGPTLRIRPS